MFSSKNGLVIGASTILGLAALGCGSSTQGNLGSQQHDLIVDQVPKSAFNTAHRAACGNGGLTAAGADALVRWPYLQKMTDNSVDIMWTAAPSLAPAQVRVTLPSGEVHGEFDARVDAQQPGYLQYAASVGGLESETMYCYELLGADGTWQMSTGFRTAPSADSETHVRISVIGDLGTQTGDQFAVRDQLKNVESDFVLVVGDLAYETGTLDDHENNFFTVYRELLVSVPFFVISGNHDYASDGAVFREVFGLFENGGTAGRERWYSFDWGQIHLTAIDTEVLSEEQAAWVADDLAATVQPWKFVFMHKPPYSSGWHGSDTGVQSLFVDAFEQYGVDLVLAGHDHNYERTEPIDGVTYVVTGAGGRGTRPVGTSDFTAYSEAVAHFSHLRLEPGSLRLNAIDALGGDFDSVVIE